LAESGASKRKPRPPATTPEAREKQLIAAAYDLAEKQIREGTASAQVVTHFLKLGTTREKLEQERLGNENALLQAKVGQIASAEDTKILYEEALKAMRTYSGNGDPEDYASR
jgi:hypothetical protein